MRILLITLFISFNAFGQSNQDKKFQKKYQLVVVNRGLDLKAAFVPVSKEIIYSTELTSLSYTGKQLESNWTNSLFEAGLETADYYYERTAKDANNREMNLKNTRVIQGRYTFKFDKNSIEIEDANENFKTVATMRFKGPLKIHYSNDLADVRNYFIRKLIESNK